MIPEKRGIHAEFIQQERIQWSYEKKMAQFLLYEWVYE